MAVIWLNGTIASGKTTVGRALARLLRARFLDGDDLAGPPDLPQAQRWEIASKRLLRAARQARLLVIAYPIGPGDNARLRALRQPSLVINLATPLVLTLRGRGRALSPTERARIREMRSKAYHRRRFADLTLPNAGDSAYRTARTIAGIYAAARRCPPASTPASPRAG